MKLFGLLRSDGVEERTLYRFRVFKALLWEIHCNIALLLSSVLLNLLVFLRLCFVALALIVVDFQWSF